MRIACGGCAMLVFYPMDAIASAHGSDLAMCDVLTRLRCTICGTRLPDGVDLVEWIETDGSGPD